MKLSYSREAIGDINPAIYIVAGLIIRLREFIVAKNPEAAQKIAKSIRKGVTQLKTFPYLGVEVEQAPNPEVIRDLIIGNYIARYLIHAKQIYILRVWHHNEERL